MQYGYCERTILGFVMQAAGEFWVDLPDEVEKERVRVISPVRRYTSSADCAEFQNHGIEVAGLHIILSSHLK
jgi:hypothetical protein